MTRSDHATPAPARWLTVLSLAAVALFAAWGIGTPLLGAAVFAPTDELTYYSPYLDSGMGGQVIQNTAMDDVYTSELPNEVLYAQSVRDGHPASWNPYMSGGQPLADSPNYALLSPLSLPFYALPGWLAPAYEKLLEIVAAVGGAYLFLRRLRLSRVAAVVGGTVFASSAFMVVWTGWPQTRVAAFVPALFWGIERLVTQRRVRDAALVALSVAAMLLGGFPAVTLYALLTGAAYFVVRVLARYRWAWRRMLGLALGAGGAVLAGVLLSAVQLLPFLSFYQHWLIEGRAQTAGDHLALTDLVTTIAPWAFGGVASNSDPQWYVGRNLVESMSYVGAAALVLALLAIASAGTARRLLPRGVWAFVVAGTAAWLELIYLGGPPLWLLQHLPPFSMAFSANYVGRGRSLLGFLLAVLAAAGLEALLRRRATATDQALAGGPAGGATAPAKGPAGRRRISRRRVGWWVGVGVVFGGLGAAAARDAWMTADHGDDESTRMAAFGHAALGGLALTALAAGCAVVLWRTGRGADPGGRGRRVLRGVAAGLVPVLVVAQALAFVLPYWPRSAKDTFYPTTDVERFLGANLGEQRFATTADLQMGTDVTHRLRALTGHGFVDSSFAAMVRGIPGNPIWYPTYLLMSDTPEQASSPVLDRLSTKYFVASPRQDPLGSRHEVTGDGGTVTLSPGQPVTAGMTSTGPVRAVGVTVAGPVAGALSAVDPHSVLRVTLADASGRQVASAKRLTVGMKTGKVFWVPIAAEGVAAGTPLTVTLTLDSTAPVTVAGTAGATAVSTVDGRDDGLRLVYAGSSVIYQRLNALPRVRWASRTVVEPDQDRRVALLAGGTLADNQVVLDSAGQPTAGKPATVRLDRDNTDTVSSTVDAQGAGYLVVADDDQTGWLATVDGTPADLVPADQGLVAVAVPAGRHTVALRYQTPYHDAGAWLSAGTAAGLGGLVLAEWWWIRRRWHRAEPPAAGIPAAAEPIRTGA
jgi:hypothetical protein